MTPQTLAAIRQRWTRITDQDIGEAQSLDPVLAGLNIYRDQLNALLQMRERALLVTEGMQ